MAALEQQQIHAEDKKEKKKKSQGKRKIEIELIENMASRQVAFSKRRRGLFSKASELCVLGGAEIAIVVFSGAGKLFSFGHPTADSVILRYLNCSSSSSSSMEGKEEITHIGITGVEKKMRSGFWWDEPIDENLGLDEFEQLKVALEGLRNRVASRLHEINFSVMGYDNFNYDNNVGFEDQQIVDFGGMGWGNFSQAACDFAWMGYPYPVHHGMDGTTLRM